MWSSRSSNLRFVVALSLIAVNQVIAQDEVLPKKTEADNGVVVTDLDQDGDTDLRFTELLYEVDVMLINGQQRQRLGITTAAADATLRAQLTLPDGKGLVVAHLEEGGPAAKAGVLLHDILLTASDTSLLTVKDLDDVINKVPGGTIDIQVFREGEIIPLTVRAAQPWQAEVELVTDALIRADAHRIGVEVVPASAALRTQLRLPNEQGIVIKRFVPDEGSPAEQAGIKEHDVLLSAAKRVLSSPEDLRNVVESSEGKPITIALLRRGKRETVIVTPQKGSAFISDRMLQLRAAPQLRDLVELPAIQYQELPVIEIEPAKRIGIGSKNGTPGEEPDADPSAKLRTILHQLEKLTASVEQLKSDLDSAGPGEAGGGAGAAESHRE